MAAEVPDVTAVTPLTKLPDLELEIINSEEISLTPTMWVGNSPYYHAFASGGYADIYKATRISDGRAKAVVVKVFRNAHLQTTNVYEKHKYINRLRREYGVWSILQHRNIHVLEGIVVKEVLASAGLVSEYKPWGSLETFLKSGPTAPFGRLCMGQGITCGLKYLHDNGIVHGDLTVANVLVDEELDGTLFPKISDFGKSRLLERDGYTTRVGDMPVVYRPPELLMHSGEEMPYNKEVLSPESDVYSLALLLLELFTGKKPYSQEYLPSFMLCAAILQPTACLRPCPAKYPMVESATDFAWPILQACWKTNPAERISSKEAHLRLCKGV